MPNKPIVIHPFAQREASVAFEWYRQRSPAAAAKFKLELAVAYEAIEKKPAGHPDYLRGTKRYLLHKFPYLVVFKEVSGSLFVFAVAHGSRKPGYWSNRLR